MIAGTLKRGIFDRFCIESLNEILTLLRFFLADYTKIDLLVALSYYNPLIILLIITQNKQKINAQHRVQAFTVCVFCASFESVCQL